MTKSKIFLILSLSFIGGVFGQSFFNVDYFWIYILTILAVILFSVFWKNKQVALIAFSFLFLALGIWRTEADLAKLKDLNLNGENFSGRVIVAKEPEAKENYQKIIFETLSVSKEFIGHEMSKLRFLANAPLHSDVNYGDELNIECVLKIPENKNGFDYRMYLAKDRIYYICDKAKIEKTGKGKGNKIYFSIIKLKNKLEENINEVIPEPEAALAKGLIIGGSSQLPKKIQENFSKTGMSHIVAVSGYNVTIIAEYLIWFFIFIGFWRKQAFWFAILGIIIFVAMIGFPSSAVRAGVTGGLLLWAMKNGRLANSYNAIVFAGAVMLAVNPLSLHWDIGFQLSFLAALGIIACVPFLEKIFIRKHKALGFSEIFFLSLSAQIFVMPIIFYNFHIFSVVSLFANLLILPIIPLSMLLVFLITASGLISTSLSLPLAWLAYLPLKYEIWIINTLAGISWSNMEIKNFGWQGIVLWYAILFALTFLLKKYKYKRLS